MKFKEFLERVTVGRPALPLVHTTQAYFLNEIIATNSLQAVPCPVFDSQNLTYFFVARPAYKKRINQQGLEDWQCPICIILAPDAISVVARAFPFDSGAFSSGRFPEYITMMKREDFEISLVPDFAERLTGSYFDDVNSYLACKPKPEQAFRAQYSVDDMDHQVLALHKLAAEFHSNQFDDRRICIEVQSSADVRLEQGTVLAVVCPLSFMQNAAVRSHIVDTWKAEPITYEIYPLNFDAYVGLIYDRVYSFYKSRGYT